MWFNWIVTDGAGGSAVGYVQATVPTSGGPAEIAWVIGKPWQGNGYTTESVRLMLGELASHGVTEVIAHIHPGHHVRAPHSYIGYR